jgi:putative DNA primase/helicase
LNWALVGLDRISQSRFTVPKSSEQAVAELADLVSPMSAFVRQCCNQGPDKTVVIDKLYERYRDWCSDNGHHPQSKPMFGRDLRAVLPRLRTTKPHGEQREYVGIELRPIGRRNEQHSGSSGFEPQSSGSDGSREALPERSEPGEPREPHESSLQPPIADFLGKIDGRCPQCKWHISTQGHRADCPEFKIGRKQ